MRTFEIAVKLVVDVDATGEDHAGAIMSELARRINAREVSVSLLGGVPLGVKGSGLEQAGEASRILYCRCGGHLRPCAAGDPDVHCDRCGSVFPLAADGSVRLSKPKKRGA